MIAVTKLKPETKKYISLDREPVPALETQIQSTRKLVAKNQILFSEGDTATGFYIVEKGSFRSFRSSGNAGKQQTFQIYTSGKWLGIRDAAYGGTYLHNAIALEDSVVQFIEESELKRLLNSNAEFQSFVFYQVAKDSVEAENKIYSLGTRQVHAKLSEFLLQSMDLNEEEVELPITREVIASIIGVTTETLVRALTDLKSRGWVDIDKRKVCVKNRLALSKLLD
ncbi:Crp/Fnr family transcriptional regulator [Leptospira sp. 'Mane']|uniref:Crp/Fnr family transcriptional regulator n=1 Tax=Leptospira sp. 'Mane' TaxID=3387407 RepID=UPI00398BAE4D